MQAPKIPEDEAERLRELKSYDILDTEPERDFDDTAELAAHICETPISLINLIDEQRQWYKAHYGTEAREHVRNLGVCPHAILQDEVFEIPDLSVDERFIGNPLIEQELHIRFYAGIPITGADGHRLGTICVLDHQPKKLAESQRKALRTLSRQISTQLALRRERKRNELLLREMRHRVQNGYQLIENLVFLHRNADDMTPYEAFQALSDRVAALSRIQRALYTRSTGESIDLKDHLSEIIPELERTNRGVDPYLTIDSELDSLEIDRDKAVSAGLVVNELITNAAKHAFPNPSEGDRIEVRLSSHESEAVLTVTDNGVGSASESSSGESASAAGSGDKLGTDLIRSLAADFGATIELRTGTSTDQAGKRGTAAIVRWTTKRA